MAEVWHSPGAIRSPGLPYDVHMQSSAADMTGTDLPRPVPGSYWVVPGRLLVGEHPSSQSRADTMDRLRRFLRAGVTCFVDLTEPRELPSYEGLLPFATPAGRRIEYLREPITDHSVPAGRDVMSRILEVLDQALEAEHVVYLHCRAGIGRSAMAAGCWLASRPEVSGDALERLQVLWQQSAQSQSWPTVPETAEQAEFVRRWAPVAAAARLKGPGDVAALGFRADRIRAMVLGLALGDAMGAAHAHKGEATGAWTQHTSLALCLAESLLAVGHSDPRDQMARYLRWQHDGYLAATGEPARPTPDVARALATYQWRGLPMAGSHDPNDRSTASLPRVVTAVAWSARDPAAAVALAGECARTTHQSPMVLDACRYFAALLLGAIDGVAREKVLADVFEPVPGLWTAKPLRAEFVSRFQEPTAGEKRRGAGDVIEALLGVRAAVLGAADLPSAVSQSVAAGREPALSGALAGALMGAFLGSAAITPATTRGLARLEIIEEIAARLATAGGSTR
jgi:ADP-ribosyl-[dinitrogen reductase] hydrolase